MTRESLLTQALVSAEVNEDFTEAVLLLRDESKLCFCHRVDQRWAKAVGPDGRELATGEAGELLQAIAMFRLNRKHLDIHFADGSRWDRAIPRQ